MICNLEPEMFTFSRWNLVRCMCTFPGVGGKVLQQPIMSFEQHNFWCLHGNHVRRRKQWPLLYKCELLFHVCSVAQQNAFTLFVKRHVSCSCFLTPTSCRDRSDRPQAEGRKFSITTRIFWTLDKAGLKRYQQSTDTSSWNPFEIERYYFRIPRE